MRAHTLLADPLWQCLSPTAFAPLPSTVLKSLRPSSRFALSHRSRAFTSTRCQKDAVTDESSAKPSILQKLEQPAQRKSIEELYQSLSYLSVQGRLDATYELVKDMVRLRGERPSLDMYNALILCNTNTVSGAAWRVHKHLAEMEEQGMVLNSQTCHNVLTVLAVHPDHLLRADILHHMAQKWFYLTHSGWLDVVVGCLREGCFEMAFDNMNKMNEAGFSTPSWLSDMTVYMLLDAGEMDQVLQIMRKRWNEMEAGVSAALWFYCLDMASTARHHALTEFVWRVIFEKDSVQVSSGICINVMATAARHGDPALATSMFRYLTARGEPTKSMHYQLLIDSYMSQPVPDISKALAVLCVMSLERLQATVWQTRTMFTHLTEYPSAIPQAWDALVALKAEGKAIPAAATNLIIEAYVADNDFGAALQAYKQLHIFASPDRHQADIDTFGALLKGCRDAVDVEADDVEFVIEEMEGLNIKPDTITFDRLIVALIRISKQAGANLQLEKAAKYAEKAFIYNMACQSTTNVLPRWATSVALAHCLALAGSNLCWEVIEPAAKLRGNSRMEARVYESIEQAFASSTEGESATRWTEQTAYDLHR